MGLFKGNEGGVIFLNVSNGSLVNKKLDINVKGVTGYLTKIEQIEDTYEEKEITKYRLKIYDNELDKDGQRGVYLVTFFGEGWYAESFFSRIGNIILEKPFTLGVSQGKMEKVSYCWMLQDDNPKKSVREDGTEGKGIAKVEDFPHPKKVTRGKKSSYDWSLTYDKFEEVYQELKSDLEELYPEGKFIETSETQKEIDKVQAEAETDLPF